MTQEESNTQTLDDVLASLPKQIKAAQTKGDQLQLCQLHHQYGQALFADEDYVRGLKQFEEATNMAKKIGDRQLEAQLIGTQGITFIEANKVDEGYKCFEQVWEIAVEIDDNQLESDALGSMGMVHLDTGNPAMAIEKLKAALKIAEAIGDRGRQMNHLSGLGNTYLNIEAEDQAIQYFNQSYDIALELGDEGAQADFLNNIALIHNNANNHEEAIKRYEQVRSLTKKIGDLPGERNALHHLVNLYSEMNRNHDLILVYIRRAVDLSQQLDDYESEVAYYDALILVTLTLNRHAEALELIDDALQDKRLPEYPERKMQLLVNRGNACFDGHQIEGAYEAYREALDEAVRHQNRNVEARILGRIGAVQAELGDLGSAIDYANQSLEKAQRIEDTRLVGEQYCMLALAHRDLGKRSEAIEYCEKAVEIFDTATADPMKEKILNLLEELRKG